MNKTASLSVISSGILWGLISIFIRKLTFYGLSSMNIAFVRMVVAAVCFTLFLLITDRKKLKIELKDIWMFLGTGIISVELFNCFYFYTMVNAGTSVSVVLLYTSPVFIMLLSALIFKEKITLRKIVALVFTIGGCALVSGIAGGISLAPLFLLTGLCSGLFYGLYTIFGRFALKKYDTYTVTAYTFIFGLIGSLFTGKPVQTVRLIAERPQIIFWMTGIGIVSTVLPYFLYTAGLQKMESGKAAILVAVEPLVGCLLGLLVYNEECSVFKIAGIICIFAAIIILNMSDKNQKSAVTEN